VWRCLGGCLGSARVSRAGESVTLSRTFRNAPLKRTAGPAKKASFGATPKPTRETRALPRIDMTLLPSFNARFAGFID
jgi:hypothetical protein